VKGKGKAESIKRVVDFKKARRIFFFWGGMLQLLLSEMVISILIPEFKLRGFNFG